LIDVAHQSLADYIPCQWVFFLGVVTHPSC
jgi:hypothetical protein